MTTTSAPATLVTAAYEAVKKLAEAELSLWKQAQDKRKELGSSETGEQILDGYLEGQEAKAVSKVTGLRNEVESLERASIAARERRRNAIREYFTVPAAEARKQAAQLLRAADEVDKKAQPHLEALKEIQGVNYAPCQLKPGFDEALNVEVRSKSQVLKDEAAAKNIQASEWARRPVHTSITVQGVDESDLIQGVMERPLIMAPPLDSIVEWFYAERKRVPRDG